MLISWIQNLGSLTMACKTAECGKLGSFGCRCMDARNDGLCRTREPHGSHLKKTSMLKNEHENAYL